MEIPGIRMEIEDETEEDAWKQHANLLKRFTRTWKPRPDLVVTGHATERKVSLMLTDKPKGLEPPTGSYKITQRNVSTMRELANCLIAACDFVEEQNPRWASHPAPVQPASDFVKEK